MKTAKLFQNGRSQAVRLPKEFQFEGEEVYIKKTPTGVLLMSKEDIELDAWFKKLQKHKTPFMSKRDQPENQERKGLDELFT